MFWRLLNLGQKLKMADLLSLALDSVWSRSHSKIIQIRLSLSLSHLYPGSGVGLDCIDSRSLHPYLLYFLKLSMNFCFHRTQCKMQIIYGNADRC